MRALPAEITRLERRVAALTQDSTTAKVHATDPVTIGTRPSSRHDALEALATCLQALPALVVETRRVPLGRYRGLHFGLMQHPQGAPEVYVEGALRRSISLARDVHGPRAILNAVDRLIGTAEKKGGVVSFVIEDPVIASLDVGTRLDHMGIAVRTGHHCCQPVMQRMGVPATVRASVAFYNTLEEIDALAAGVRQIVEAERAKQSKKPAVSAPSQGTPFKFPEPAAASPGAAAASLIDDFEMFDDWTDRYQYIISLGEKLPPMPVELKTEANRVHGCQSTVHLFARKRPSSSDAIDFIADSDADVVRGLIGILEKVLAGQSAREILAFDIEGFFKQLGLDQNLSMGRRNGLASMIQRIRAYAKALQPAAV